MLFRHDAVNIRQEWNLIKKGGYIKVRSKVHYVLHHVLYYVLHRAIYNTMFSLHFQKYQHFDRLALSMSLHHMRGNSPSKVVNELLNSVYSPEQQASYSLMGALGLRGDGIQLRKKRLPVTLYTEILGQLKVVCDKLAMLTFVCLVLLVMSQTFQIAEMCWEAGLFPCFHIVMYY